MATPHANGNGIEEVVLDERLSEVPEKTDAKEKRVRFDELGLEVRRAMIATRELVVGVGGVGFRGVLQLAHALHAKGIKFGEPDVKRKLVADALLVDGDSRTFDLKREEVKFLEGMGVHFVHMYVPHQEAAFRQAGLTFTPGTPVKEDIDGCNAEPKVGLGRYTCVRKLPARTPDGKNQNPVALAAEIMASWIRPGQPRLAPGVNIDVIGGLSGGTASAVTTALYADLVAKAEEALSSEAIINGRAILMTGEPFKLDGTVSRRGGQDKRNRNSAVAEMCIDQQTRMHGIKLPDGTFLDGIPRIVTITDGRSKDISVGDNGAYDAIEVVVKTLVAEMCGEGGDGRSTLSNMRDDLVTVDLSSGSEAPLARFSLSGACEAVSNPHRVLLERDKRIDLFRRTYGLDLLSGVKEGEVKTIAESILSPDFIQRLIDSIEAPIMTRGEIFVQGQEDEVSTKVGPAIETFTQVKLPQVRGVVKAALEKAAKNILRQLAEKTKTMLREEGITAEVNLLEKLNAVLAEMERECQSQNRLLGEELAQDLEPGKAMLTRRLENREPLPSKWNPLGGRAAAIHSLIADVDALVEHMNTIGKTNQEQKVHAFLLSAIQGHLKPMIIKLLQAARQRLSEAKAVLGGIKEAYDPKAAGVTVVDYEINVTPHWSEDPAQLRTKLTGFSRDDMLGFVDGIKLSPEDTNLIPKLSPEITEAMGAFAQPLVRFSPFADLARERGHIAFMSVPPGQIERDEEDRIIGTREIPVPTGFRPVPTELDGTVMAGVESHGYSPLDRTYFVECLKQILALPPSEREKAFHIPGDMEAILPRWATVLAKAEAKRHEGTVIPCSGCKLDMFRPARSDITCCEGCKPQAKK